MTFEKSLDVVKSTRDPMVNPARVSLAIGVLHKEAARAFRAIGEELKPFGPTATVGQLGWDDTTETWRSDATASTRLRRAVGTLALVMPHMETVERLRKDLDEQYEVYRELVN